MSKKVGLIPLTAIALFLVAGCASNGKVAVGKGNKLVNNANHLYAKGRFNQATLKYRMVTEEFPDSQYRRMAILGLADSLYKDKQYFESILYYERFLELYPLDPLTPRAQFYLAMSYYRDTDTHDRDQGETIKAIDAFDRFLRKYPDHQLAPYAIKMKAEMITLKARNSLEIARFYRRINRNQSAIIRLNEYLETYPESSDVPEALFMLAESFRAEQSLKNAAKVYIELIKKFPKNDYAQQAMAIAKTIKLNE